jgi:hypothetical protein
MKFSSFSDSVGCNKSRHFKNKNNKNDSADTYRDDDQE